MAERVSGLELNDELSEKEDLIAQLYENDKITEIMKQNIEIYRREKEEYAQLVFQFQRKGMFLDQGKYGQCLL